MKAVPVIPGHSYDVTWNGVKVKDVQASHACEAITRVVTKASLLPFKKK